MKQLRQNNPQVLDEGHILRRDCFGSFWTRNYMTSTGGVQTIDTFDVWCREHKRFEPLKLTSQLLMQLGGGLLDFDE